MGMSVKKKGKIREAKSYLFLLIRANPIYTNLLKTKMNVALVELRLRYSIFSGLFHFGD